MIRVLFICLGNICRSPMAEAVFLQKVNAENLSNKIEVDSAGTANWHTGKPPHYGTREILDQYNVPYEGIKARQVHAKDWDNFSYIIAMEDQNIKDLIHDFNKNGQVMIAKLMDFVDEPEVENIPDPYYTGDFNYTYRLVSNGCQKLLEHIRDRHNL